MADLRPAARLTRFASVALLLLVPACSTQKPLVAQNGPLPLPAESTAPAATTEALDSAAPLTAFPDFAAALKPSDDWKDLAWERLRRDIGLSLEDYRTYYAAPNLTGLALGLGGSAALAHTRADRSVRDWYQQKVRGTTTDRLLDIANVGGQLWVVAPVCLEAMALLGKTDERYLFDEGWHEWSNRSLRAMAVGFPPVVLFYGLLGSGRPDRGDSRWHPFRDIRGVSGHTFTGAVPFLTAAAMTDNPWLKTSLFLGSCLTGWSRLNMDRHYLSQIALGWWMAYLATRSVTETHETWRPFSITPMFLDGPGIAVQFRY